MRKSLLLLSLGLSAIAAAQDPVDDAPRPGEGLALRFGVWFPTRSGGDPGISYGVGYLLPSQKALRFEVEYYGSSLRVNTAGGRENVNLYKVGGNVLYMPSSMAYYYGAGIGLGGGSGTGATTTELVGNALIGYKVDKNLFAEARFNLGSKDFLNGFGINLGYRF